VPSSAIAKRVDETLDSLSLGEVRNRVIGNLSKGYRQRVALAQAIVHDPDVLVLDEPTEGLDPNQIVHIRELIRSLAGRHTTILSSHILSEVQNTCDHIVIIDKGHVVTQGTYEELSQTIQSGHVYRLRTARDLQNVMSKISTLPGISNVKSVPEANEIEFSVSSASGGDAVLDDVARKIVDGGYGLRELSLKTKSLEEVFFQLTK
jgi:ABC-2 type transport system ATP-binding protein